MEYVVDVNGHIGFVVMVCIARVKSSLVRGRQDSSSTPPLPPQVMSNRKIRVDVAEGEGGNQRRGFSDRSNRDDDRFDRSEGVSDWRAAPPREGECVPPVLSCFCPLIYLEGFLCLYEFKHFLHDL